MGDVETGELHKFILNTLQRLIYTVDSFSSLNFSLFPIASTRYISLALRYSEGIEAANIKKVNKYCCSIKIFKKYTIKLQ